MIEPLRWFCRYSNGARGAIEECLESVSFDDGPLLEDDEGFN